MQSSVQFGVCVACGRTVGIRQASCPYCSERVYLPIWFCWGRRGLFMLSGVLAGYLLVRDYDAICAAMLGFSGLQGFLFSAGSAILYYPDAFERHIILSRRSMYPLVLGLLLVASFLLVTGIACGWGLRSHADAWGTALFSGTLLVCASVSTLAYGVGLQRLLGLVCIVFAWVIC